MFKRIKIMNDLIMNVMMDFEGVVLVLASVVKLHGNNNIGDAMEDI